MVDFPPPTHMKKEELPRKYIMYSSLVASKMPSDLIFSSLENIQRRPWKNDYRVRFWN